MRAVLFSIILYTLILIYLFRINALAWDSDQEILYIGGLINLLDHHSIPPGIAVWSQKTGMHAFPGGGFTISDEGDAEIIGLVFEPVSQVRV